jgi:hypothetical protein
LGTEGLWLGTTRINRLVGNTAKDVFSHRDVPSRHPGPGPRATANAGESKT